MFFLSERITNMYYKRDIKDREKYKKDI